MEKWDCQRHCPQKQIFIILPGEWLSLKGNLEFSSSPSLSLSPVCCGLCICSQEEASVMMAERGTGLCVYQNVIGVVLWLYFVGFFCCCLFLFLEQ